MDDSLDTMVSMKASVGSDDVMEKIIQRCTEHIEMASHREIPKFVWKNCKGLAIIDVSEFGLGFSVSQGGGLVMQHNTDGTWGPPSALILSGVAGGIILGKSNKQILLFPMTQHGLKMLTSNTKYQLGAQAGLAVGPFGREIGAGLDVGDKGVGATLSYVFEDGGIVSLGIQNNFIDPLYHVNDAFYGKQQVSATDIVMTPGAVDIPAGKGVEEMHAKLAELSK